MTFARTAIDGAYNTASSTTIAQAGYTSVAGRLITGYVAWEGGNTSVNIADTAGNTYVVGTPIVHTNADQVIAHFYCLSSAGNASNVITATFGATRSYRVIQSAEYSYSGTAAIDGISSGVASAGASVTSGSITTTGAVGLLFAGSKAYAQTTLGAGGSLSLITYQGTSSTNAFGADGEQLLTSAGSYAAQMTSSPSQDLSLVALAFKEVAGGPTVSTVSSNSATEGTSIVHTVTLSAAVTGSAASYAITLAGGTATGGGTDYTSTLSNGMFSNSVTVSGGNISVPVGVSTFTVTVSTAGDTIDEANETYTLTIGGTAGTGTINDDDAAPVITVGDAPSVTAGSPAVFTISLDRAKSTSITVDAACVDGTLVGGVGYTSDLTLATISNGVTFGAGALTIPAGVTSFTVSIPTA